jgi:serine/threonine-protein kinase
MAGTDLIGGVISRYRVLEELGSGGMGVVYRAHDEVLGRDVAIKVLHAGALSTEEARERFRDEARALSRFSHPAISTIFDFDTSAGVDFLVMELVEGKTLDRLLEAGPLAERDVGSIGAQIAEALGAAHDRDVIHRDLKAGNVMITPQRRVKLLDFGLARFCRNPAASGDTVSVSGIAPVAGTVAYMSPEQLLGREIDSRADLFSLGVLLYEMATGRRPFTASPATALVNEILHKPAPPPATVGARLSPGMERLILALLEKDPKRRPESAGIVESALKSPGGPGFGPSAALTPASASSAAPALPALRSAIESIAVLPLENLSRDPEQEFFADGMTEALILNLAQIRGLRVVSRTSVMGFKGVRKPLSEIAGALGVDAVVEGSVARSGSRVRITAQLIEVARDTHLWARSYERDLSDVLALQGEVAEAIVREIRGELSLEEQSRLAETRRVDPPAYEAFLRGRHHWNRRTEEEVKKGIAYFESAIARDPLYAQAYAALARAYDTMGTYSFIPPAEAFAKAAAAAARALELDPELAEAHTALGGVRFAYQWDWEGAESELRRGIVLSPSFADGYHWYSDFLCAMGRPDEAIAAIRRAHELEPLSLTINMSLGSCLFYARRYDEAIQQHQRTLELDPRFAPALRNLGGALEQKGLLDEAIETFRKAVALSRGDLSAAGLLAHAYGVAGRKDEARRILAELEAESANRYVSPYTLAAIHIPLGETEAALDKLERAFERRDRGIIWMKVSPRLDPIRAEPRFTDLLRRMRLGD